jgi:rare lipoprotein A
MTTNRIGRQVFFNEIMPGRPNREAGNRRRNLPVYAPWLLLFILLFSAQAFADTASYYTLESCLAEGSSGIMANKEVMDNESLTCASWFYPFGTRLKVSSVDTGRSVVCVVTDRGPSKKLVKKGRVIDLSVATFAKLAPLSKGVIKVKIEKVSQ